MGNDGGMNDWISFSNVLNTHRQRHTETHRHTQTQTETETYRHTDTQTETDRHT